MLLDLLYAPGQHFLNDPTHLVLIHRGLHTQPLCVPGPASLTFTPPGTPSLQISSLATLPGVGSWDLGRKRQSEKHQQANQETSVSAHSATRAIHTNDFNLPVPLQAAGAGNSAAERRTKEGACLNETM